MSYLTPTGVELRAASNLLDDIAGLITSISTPGMKAIMIYMLDDHLCSCPLAKVPDNVFKFARIKPCHIATGITGSAWNCIFNKCLIYVTGEVVTS